MCFPSEIKNIKTLISQGEFTEALNKIEPLLSSPELSNDEQLTCKLTKIDILNQSGDFRQVVTLADALYDESIVLNALIYAVDAYTFKSTALWRLGMLDEGLQTINTAENLLEQMSNISYKEALERKAVLELRRGNIFGNKGDLDGALENTFNGLALCEELGIKKEIARS